MRATTQLKGDLFFVRIGGGRCFMLCGGGWIRTNDLLVMSQVSCHCSTPHFHFAKLQGISRITKFFHSDRNEKTDCNDAPSPCN